MPSTASSPIDRAVTIAKSPRARKILWWIFGLVAAYALIGFLVVPPIVKPMIEEKLSQMLHRGVTLETLRVNPFVPSATVRGFMVRERSVDAPFVTFDELYLNGGWSSIIRLAPVIDEARLTRPHARLMRNADQTYNFQDLVDEFLARPKDDEPPPKFAAFNLQLVDGRIDIDDRATGQKHEVADLRIGIPFISSLPSQVDVTVLPEISARVNGAPVGMKGETLPFKDTHVTTLNLDLDQFDLTRLAGYLPFEVRGKVKSALLDTRLVVAFEQRPGGAPQIKVRGAAAVTGLNVHDAQDRPMAACERIAVELNEVDPFAPSVDLKSVAIEAPDVHIRREKSGAINLEHVGIVAAEGDQMQRQSRQKTGKAAVPIKFGSFVVTSGKVHFTDETTEPTFEAAVEQLQLEARNFDNTEKDRRNEIAIQARTEAGESLKLDITTIADPRSAEGRLEVDALRLKSFQPYLSQASNLEVDDGRFDIGFAFRWASDLSYEQHELTISDLALALKGFRSRLRGEKEPLFRVASIEVQGAGAQLKSQTANLGAITVREAMMNLRREKDGGLNVERIVREGTAAEPSPGAKPGEKPAAPPATPWQIDLGTLLLERSSVALEDRAVGAPVKVGIAPVQLKVQNLSTAKGKRGNVDLRATIEQRGRFAANGSLSIEPLAGSLRIDARTIDFALLQRYIDDQVNFAVTSGAVSARGNASFESAPDRALKASYKGSVGITDFASVDRPKKADLLKWKSLTVDAVDFDLQPLKVGLGEIALADFYARVILSPEGRLNIQDLMQPPGAAAAGKPPAAPSAKSKNAAAERGAAAPTDIRLGPIKLDGGMVDFSDFFIRPNYSAKLSDIHGSLTEMTPTKASEVDLHAKGEYAASVDILRKVNPLAPSVFLDVQGTAREFELPPMSTYSMKYLGYKIAQGKLTFKAKYRIENNKLEAENNIVLDQFTLGDKVESPDAPNLPLLAAVAILKDRNGVINLTISVSGSLDDPKFSLGAAARQVVGDQVTKAATAPFSVLGASVGGGEDLAYLEFAPGSAALDAASADKLRKLTKLLQERPDLKLVIIGRVDPAADRAALQGAGTGQAKVQAGDEALQRLAEARAEAARGWLANEGKLPSDRLSVGAPKLTAEGISDKGKPTRVDFGLK